MMLDYTLPRRKFYMPPTQEEFSIFSHDVMAKMEDLYNRINLVALDLAVLKSKMDTRDKSNETRLKNWITIIVGSFASLDFILNHFVYRK